MKYLSLYTPARRNGPPSQEHMEAMGKLIEESMKSGELVTTGGLMPLSKGGARVRHAGSTITVIDGPFTESKEVVGGFAILEAKSREDVIEMARKFLTVAGDGETDIFPLMMEHAE